MYVKKYLRVSMYCLYLRVFMCRMYMCVSMYCMYICVSMCLHIYVFANVCMHLCICISVYACNPRYIMPPTPYPRALVHALSSL